MPQQASKLRRVGYFALAAALLTVSLIALLSFEEGRRYDAAFAQANTSRQLLTLNQELIDCLRDAETGQRGYLLTGRAEYLAPYDDAVKSLPVKMQQLLDLAKPKPDISRLAQQIQSETDAKRAELQRTIDLYRSSGAGAALSLVLNGGGKEIMDRIRATSRQIQDLEDQRRLAARDEIQSDSATIRTIVLLGSLLLVVLLASAAFALSKATQRSEETLNLLRSTLYGIGDGVITTDRNGAVQLMNVVAERLTGFKEADAFGRGIEDVFRLVKDPTNTALENPVRSALRDPKPSGFSNHGVLISRNNNQAPIENCATPLLSPADSLLGAVLIFRDITDRQDAVRVSQTLAAIVENSDDAIISKTLQGVVTTWNHAAEQLFGYTAEEIIGQPIDLIIPPDRPEDLTNILSKIALGQSVDHYMTERLTKDGRRLAVSLTVSPIRNDAGEIVGASKIARDVTHEQHLEAALRQAQKMEAIGRLAGGVAHDFNNLLTVILGYASTMTTRISEHDPIAKMAAEIRRAAEQAAAVTGQLLTFSRKQVTQPRVVELNDVLRDMQSMLQRLIGEDVGLSVVVSPTPCNILIDPGQLSQVILNLAVNARDAMPTGGALIVETKTTVRKVEDIGSHGIRPAGPYVSLSFTDSGMGMTAETQAHIFEPFFTTKESGKGTGLGLATVYGIVQQSGGWIDVYSELGHGTTFTIYIPLTAAAPAATPVKQEAPPARQPTVILLVEDQAAIRMLAEDVLLDAGHKVLSAPNGAAALKIANDHSGPIEVLITDVVMPEMSGPELVALLSQTRPNLRVLYISGFTDHALLHRGVIEQGTAFLQKPFVPAALLEKVNSLLPQNVSAHA